MRKARIFVHDQWAADLIETDEKHFILQYLPDYQEESVSLTLPFRKEPYIFDRFPPFFDGLLPEGFQLDALLRQLKIDRKDYFSQLLAVGEDTVGAVTIFLEDE